MKNHLLYEIRNSQWSIRESAVMLLEQTANEIINNPDFILKPTESVVKSHLGATMTTDTGSYNPFDSFEEGTIAIIPLSGVMTKYSSWCNYGTDMIAYFLRMADMSERITGVVLMADTPGGSVTSVFQLQDVLSRMSKPTVTLVDGYLCSAGIWAASYSHKIFAINEMTVIGSIGVMTTLTDYSEMYEQKGIRMRSIYPPESSFKNLPHRNATDKENPDDELLIKEVLSPVAKNFQDVVVKNRPNIDQSVEGILAGREFYASDAVKYGLIDGIKSYDEVIEYVKTESERRANIYHQLDM